MNSNYTGRMARSMQEGINPYARGPIEPMRDAAKTPRAHWALYAVAVIVAVLFAAGVI